MNVVRTRLYQARDRLFDVTCAAIGLLALSPVFLCVALLILSDDGPPIFFSQLRIGRNGRPFWIWKFRTMARGAAGGVITAAGDPRVTRSGAILRAYKLDELPQLVNVLKGEMSLIGPRPEVPEYVDTEALLWRAVLSVRPGITDPAALEYRDEERLLAASDDPLRFYRERVLPAKLLISLSYLQSKSFRQDLKLIVLTIWRSTWEKAINP